MFTKAGASDRLQHNDLHKLANAANKAKLPILLIVSQHHCPFCVRLKEEIIFPMQLSGDYQDSVIMAEILLDSADSIRDLGGKLVHPSQVGAAYNVWVTPTLLFLDHTGREVHRRMLGVNTIEMYSHYLDESLQAALSAVKRGDRSYTPTTKDIQGDAPGYDQIY
ncbi:MAG: thioredoxin fold domain-containing protein [Candidatus Thiodiazotropha lotti]|uniref:Thioredoxin fold domain-containing protein n=1 Tax=Candidatus Thiodiazotropha lotti TaxID=2792787 RepID=A0A9E4N198_9GAMM|nr:thioredoxin fold domain-containing protein [Candidatus Thiodiazotropha lotti]MCG7928811.1 thioredoxin fold domain-containing protein [Candidatus Thiodiazotropha lotti]MCG7939424.1 thioredoxin fold domain-containing protein [Candidatus Thiodiazotropha lotti]MCG8005424.1 thioredoxin fold domain-containing protein [Candidatus Thiodiazotropha lotti]MCG8008545.1 thioredoxin fold domain-containing protein [Candidatus Thiodiazotropha lotti]